MRLIWISVLCLLLAACARDPIDNPGTWKATAKGAHQQRREFARDGGQSSRI